MRADGQESGQWYDEEAGPVVRPYAMTRGRTSGPGNHKLDLIAVVIAEETGSDLAADRTLSPEHVDIVELCRSSSRSVAELAADVDLPIGVVRVLIGDLVTSGLVRVSRPVPPAELPDEHVLRDVIDGLRAL